MRRECPATGRKIIRAHIRVAGDDPNTALRAYADAACTVQVAESILGNLVNGTWYDLTLCVPTGALYYRFRSLEYSAFYGPVSIALDVAHGTRLVIDIDWSSPNWIPSYTNDDPNAYVLINPTTRTLTTEAGDHLTTEDDIELTT